MDVIPQELHKYVVSEYPSTCKDDGRIVYTCEKCGNTYSITIPSPNVEHTWKSKEDDGWVPVYGDEPSCRQAGRMIRECEVCGFTETKTGTKLEHISVVSKTDCTRKVCEVCGTDLGASGQQHQIVWKPNGPLTADGEHIGTCTVCGKTFREGHVYQDDNDCTTDVKCEKCGLVVLKGNSEHNRYPLFDENGSPYYNGKDNGDGTHTRYCSNEGCDQVTNVSEPHEYEYGADGEAICTVCGAKEEDDKQCEHQWSETITVEATCQNPGKTYRKCEICGILKDETVTPKTDHSYGEWKVTKEATCTDAGQKVRVCQTPGCTAAETETIAALGHKAEKFACGTKKCTVCGEVLENGNKHHVKNWTPDPAQSGKHTGVCEKCGETVSAEHNADKDDGDCTTAVTCTECGAVVKEASGGHNLYPRFDEDNNPYYKGVDNKNGTHTRICSNEGCKQETGVTEDHEFGEDGRCIVCGAKEKSHGGSTGKDPQETKPQGTTSPAESAPAGSGNTVNTGSNTLKPASGLPVAVELPEGMSGSVALTVENVTETNASVRATVEKVFQKFVAYDITLVNGNVSVQPDGTVKVTIGLPEGWENVDVYHVDGDTMTKMPTTVENGNVVFTTTHFSVYALVNNASAVSPKTGDNAANTAGTCIALFALASLCTCVLYRRRQGSVR